MRAAQDPRPSAGHPSPRLYEDAAASHDRNEVTVKVQFIRSLIDAVFSSHSIATREAVTNRLPARVLALTHGASAHQESLTYDDAQSLLFSLDQALGDGSGRALEEAGAALAARTLSESGQTPSSNPLFAMQSFGRAMTQAMPSSNVVRETTSRDGSAVLVLSIAGHPGLTRLLRHLATGFIRGATRTEDSLILSGEMDGDEAVVRAIVQALETSPAPSKRPTLRPSMAPRATSLTAQVEAILRPPGGRGEPRK